MEDLGLITKQNGRYALTVYGYYVETRYHSFFDEMKTLQKNEPALKEICFEDPLSPAIIKSDTSFEAIDQNTSDILNLFTHKIDEKKEILCVLPSLESAFTARLFQSFSDRYSVRLLLDNQISTTVIELFLEPYNFEPKIEHGETPKHFLVRAGTHSLIGIVARNKVRYTVYSTCTKFATIIDNHIESKTVSVEC